MKPKSRAKCFKLAGHKRCTKDSLFKIGKSEHNEQTQVVQWRLRDFFDEECRESSTPPVQKR